MMMLASFVPCTVYAAKSIKVQVQDPYIELHTGAGRGYPVFHVVERHDWVEIIYRKTEWFKVRTATGEIGWVVIDQMENTLAAPGVKTSFDRVNFDDFANRTYEMGMMLGDFETASLMSFYAAYHFQSNLSVEAMYSQATGSLTNANVFTVSVVSTPFPDWKYAPFFSIGFGRLDVEPRRALTGTSTRDSLASAGIGLRYYMTRRFMIRLEYKQNITFINDNNLGDFTEWKGGFSFFF